MKILHALTILVCIFRANKVFGSSECSARDYGKGSIVCVCNTQHCDSFESPEIKPGLVTVIESNKQGKRFATSTAQFVKTSQIEKENKKFSEFMGVKFNHNKDSETIFDFESRRLEIMNEIFEETPKFEKQNRDKKYFDIIINRTLKYQQIVGFGGAFTDSATINIKSLPENLSKRLVADYYSKNGLEYNVGRIPIAGCDFSTRGYTYDDVINDFNLTHFSLVDEDFFYKIPVIKEAMSISSEPIHFFGTAWTSPGWMKTNDELGGPGYLKGSPGGIYYKIWADYLVKFLDAYKLNGVKLWGLSTGNEPVGGMIPIYRYNALGFTPSTQRDFIKMNLGPALEKAGYSPENLKLIIHEDQIPFMPMFAETVYGNKESSKYVWGAGLHWYMNDMNLYHTLDFIHQMYPNKFLLATEACSGFDRSTMKYVPLGDWESGVKYANDIIEDLNHWLTGWVDWNLVLDETGGPNWAGNFVNAPIIVNKTAEEYYKNPMYYVMGHFSKFIKRNSVRLGFTERKSTSSSVISTVFETPRKETVLVVLNPSNDETQFSVSDSKSGFLKLTLNPNSITTLIWV